MPKEKAALSGLIPYLPEGSYESVVQYIHQYKVQLTITRKRQSILGDYRHAYAGKGHRISVNGNLNKYSFLITLLHELAHLFTYEKYGNKVVSHGKEWKKEFGMILASFLSKKIFPGNIEKALYNSLQNPAASSCGDEVLLRALREYDANKEGYIFVEQLAEGNYFLLPGDRLFQRGEKLRKRFKCQEIETGKWYLFSSVYEVRPATK